MISGPIRPAGRLAGKPEAQDTGRQLSAFLQELADRPFEIGACDCALAVADWVRCRTGIDPAAPIRGIYDDDDGWRGVVFNAGGMVPLYDRLAGAVPLRRVDAPLVGDIGVVVTHLGEVGAIRVERGWAVKMRRGLAVGPFVDRAIWRVE